MILQAEVMREYDEVFVKKRVFSARMDAGVQTDYSELSGGRSQSRRWLMRVCFRSIWADVRNNQYARNLGRDLDLCMHLRVSDEISSCSVTVAL